jgi:hypothetical protein
VNPLTKARLIWIAVVACLLAFYLGGVAGPLKPMNFADGSG